MKKVLIVIGLLVVALLATALLRDKEFKVEASISIDAPKEIVWEHISSLQKQNEWSPWSALDPNMTTEHKGNPGEVGSTYHWKGNDDVGEGEQEITAVTPMERIEQDLRFIAPFESTADVFINLKDGENGAQIVEWGFDSEHNFMSGLIDLFADMEGSIKKDYDKGLAALKEMVEAIKVEVPEEAPVADVINVDGFDILNMEMPNAAFIGVRQEVAIDKVNDFLASTYKSVSEELANAGYEPTGMPSALYFSWDEEAGTTDVAAAMPMGPSEVGLVGFETFNLAQGPAFVIDHHGDHEGLPAAHAAILKALEGNGMEAAGPALEEYIIDGNTEADPNKWHTKITYAVK